VKGLGCENYFALLVTGQWFSYLERSHFIHSKKRGQKCSSIRNATFERMFLIVLG